MNSTIIPGKVDIVAYSKSEIEGWQPVGPIGLLECTTCGCTDIRKSSNGKERLGCPECGTSSIFNRSVYFRLCGRLENREEIPRLPIEAWINGIRYQGLLELASMLGQNKEHLTFEGRRLLRTVSAEAIDFPERPSALLLPVPKKSPA